MGELLNSKVDSARSRIKEIDGIRAIALLAVLVFHGRFGSIMKGGFLGVDIFFVISGYVITLSLRNSIARGSMNYKEFMIRRLFRLIPALLATVLLTNLFCTIIFSRKDRFRAARFSVGSVLSMSNVQLWMESNYFDVNSLRKPFLHTWSLSVEWQFYITWALIVHKICKNISSLRAQTGAIIFIGLLSILGADYTRRLYPSAAFYNFCFRYVEFMCGALAAWNLKGELLTQPNFFNGKAFRTAISLSSLFIIFSLLQLFRDSFPFPGIASLPICLSTVFLITNSPGTIAGRFLSLKSMQWLGEISYSVYLVHWPVQVLIHYFMMQRSTMIQRFFGTILSIFLGYLLNKTVEKPFQESKSRKENFSRSKKFTTLGIGLILLVSEALYMRRNSIGISQKTSEVLSIIENSWNLAGSRGWEIRPKCRSIGRHDNLRNFEKCNPEAEDEFVLVGDSHAADLWFALNYTFPRVSTIQICGTGCGLHRYHHPLSGCGKIFGAYQKKLRKRRSRIRAAFLVSKWHVLNPKSINSTVLHSFVNYFQRRTNATIFVLGPRPEFKPHPNEVFERSGIRECVNELEIRTNKFMRVENNSESVLYDFAVRKNVTFLSIPQIMCNATKIGQPSEEYFCPTIDRSVPSSLYCDTTHYNRAGATKLIQKLKPMIDKVLEENRDADYIAK